MHDECFRKLQVNLLRRLQGNIRDMKESERIKALWTTKYEAARPHCRCACASGFLCPVLSQGRSSVRRVGDMDDGDGAAAARKARLEAELAKRAERDAKAKQEEREARAAEREASRLRNLQWKEERRQARELAEREAQLAPPPPPPLPPAHGGEWPPDSPGYAMWPPSTQAAAVPYVPHLAATSGPGGMPYAMPNPTLGGGWQPGATYPLHGHSGADPAEPSRVAPPPTGTEGGLAPPSYDTELPFHFSLPPPPAAGRTLRGAPLAVVPRLTADARPPSFNLEREHGAFPDLSVTGEPSPQSASAEVGGSGGGGDAASASLSNVSMEMREACPICLTAHAADVRLDPCGHVLCTNCIRSWASERTSYATTARTGSADVTCPICRQPSTTAPPTAQRTPAVAQGRFPPSTARSATAAAAAVAAVARPSNGGGSSAAAASTAAGAPSASSSSWPRSRPLPAADADKLTVLEMPYHRFDAALTGRSDVHCGWVAAIIGKRGVTVAAIEATSGAKARADQRPRCGARSARVAPRQAVARAPSCAVARAPSCAVARSELRASCARTHRSGVAPPHAPYTLPPLPPH